jgi:hypothetical protein
VHLPQKLEAHQPERSTNYKKISKHMQWRQFKIHTSKQVDHSRAVLEFFCLSELLYAAVHEITNSSELSL